MTRRQATHEGLPAVSVCRGMQNYTPLSDVEWEINLDYRPDRG